MSKRRLIILSILLIPVLAFAGKQLHNKKSYGPITEKDRLWDIIEDAYGQQDGITPQQAMIATMQKNPTAFYAPNVNALLEGTRLALPNIDEIKAIDEERAVRLVLLQNSSWGDNNERMIIDIQAPDPVTHTQVASVSNVFVKQAPAQIPEPAWDKIELPMPQFAKITIDIKQEQTEPQVSPRPILLAFNTLEHQRISLQLDQIYQNTEEFKRETKSKILGLEEEIQILRAQVNLFEQQLNAMLVQQGDSTAATMQQTQHTMISSWVDKIISFTNSTKNVIGDRALVMLTALLILALVSMQWIKRNRRQAAKAAQQQHSINTQDTDEDTQDEYDFLGSEEGIPAKLDLARAYIAMEDSSSAHEVIMEVIDQGNPQQVAEAQKLLNQIEK